MVTKKPKPYFKATGGEKIADIELNSPQGRDLKCLFDGKPMTIKLSKKAVKELNELRQKLKLQEVPATSKSWWDLERKQIEKDGLQHIRERIRLWQFKRCKAQNLLDLREQMKAIDYNYSILLQKQQAGYLKEIKELKAKHSQELKEFGK